MSGVIKNSLLVVVSTMLALILLETTMLVVDSAGLFAPFFKKLERLEPNFDLEEGAGLYYSHPYISYEIRPGYQSAGKAHINSLGFRGDPVAENKASGTFRIVALGDSTTYGIYNRYNETYPYLLQEQMRRKFPANLVEVINAGLVSATSAENLIRLLFRILPLRPDMIIVYGGGDIFPRVFDKYKGDYSHFRRTPTTRGSSLTSFYLARLLEYSVLWRVWPETGLQNVNLFDYTWRMENLPQDEAKRIDNFRKSGPAVYRRNLKYIIDAALDNGVKPVVVTLAYNKDASNWLKLIPDEVWDKGIKENNEVVLELAQKYQLPLCDFYAYGMKDKKIFKDSIHLSPYGNAKLAECILQSIKEFVGGILTTSAVGGDHGP